MGAPLQRPVCCADLGSLRGGDEAFADVAAGQRPVFGAVPALEQQRHRWAPGLLEHVVGGDQRQRGFAGADAEDDRGEDLGEFA